MPLYLAIDAGGTKTDYLLADEHAVLARSRSGTVKRLRTTAAVAAEHLDAGLAELTRQSGRSLRDVTRTVLGTAGESVPLVTEFLRQQLSSRVGGQLLLVGDVEIALDAAFHGGPGVLVLAGTGSKRGRARRSRQPVPPRRVGGRCWPTRVPVTASVSPRFERSSLPSMRATKARCFLSFFATGSSRRGKPSSNMQMPHPAPDFSSLVGSVLATALGGDHLAQRVLRLQGEELAHLVNLLLHSMPLARAAHVACAGSILDAVAPPSATR